MLNKYELENYYTIGQIRCMTSYFQRILERVPISDAQWNEAKFISKERKIPLGDVIHAILARDANAALVSWDKHFQLLRDICTVIKPSDVPA